MKKVIPNKKTPDPAPNPVGRPSDYGPEVLEKAEAYLNGGWKKEGDVVPIIEGLAEAINVTRVTCYEWAKDERKPEFTYIFEQVLKKQARLLAANGLAGTFNPTITKLFLSKHGYIEKAETDVTSNGKELKPGTIVINNPGPPREDA